MSRGVSTRIYVGGHKRGMGLVVPGNSPIKDVSDLRGKNIATLGRGSLPDMQLRVTAKEHGLDPDRDFNLITLPSSDAVTALKKGAIDGLMNCPEWPQVALTAIPGSRFLVTDIYGTLWHGPETQCVVVIVKEDFAKSNPRVLKKLLHVHVKATRTMLDEPEKSSEIIAKFEGAPSKATRLALSHMDITPVPSISSIVKWRDKMLEFGLIKRKAKIDEIVELAPLREVLEEADEKQWLSDLDKEIALMNEVKKREA
jgi:ABC-type nitrate/sulfonate/bicarbonate transport system substrate-binding protein